MNLSHDLLESNREEGGIGSLARGHREIREIREIREQLWAYSRSRSKCLPVLPVLPTYNARILARVDG